MQSGRPSSRVAGLKVVLREICYHVESVPLVVVPQIASNLINGNIYIYSCATCGQNDENLEDHVTEA